MINHGLEHGALFLVIGMIYDRYHTRDIDQLSAWPKACHAGVLLHLFTLSSIGLPGTNGFCERVPDDPGRIHLAALGIPFGVVAATGIVLARIYMLHMAARVIWGR
jgi:NADH-quinone oxidoreductase subunit M